MATYGYSGKIVQFTVQTPGTFDISAYGGGGGATSVNSGGKGAEAGGLFNLTQGEKLEFVAGGAGFYGTGSGGGGGASEVFANTGANGAYVPLLVAGGGGGGSSYQMAAGGNASGTGGSGAGGSAEFGGGGAGVKSNGDKYIYGGGSDLANGAYGGTPANANLKTAGSGGFGGGGAGDGGGGGGGGYTGGAGGNESNYGGAGGTSYIAASGMPDTLQTKNGADAPNIGNGRVTFSPDLACYVTGTRIRVVRRGGPAEELVETLQVGDLAVTASGVHRPIRWLGHRTIDCHRHPGPRTVLPIRIAAHAFGDSRPARDLYVSPGHAICVDVLDDVLIPAGALVNGTTIVQVEVDEVVYWHVELESHDIILAENMPAESYLEMGNRTFFNDADVVALAASPDAPGRTHADFCRPFHADGPIVDAVQARLRSRAATISTGHHHNPALDRNVA